MRVLQLIWCGVLAFDRLGSRIRQLLQIWLVEFLFAMPLMFLIAKVIDVRGAFGVPGTGEALGGVFWGALAVSLVCGFLFVRGLLRPRVVSGSWTPMVHADVGGVTVYGGNRSWTTHYAVPDQSPVVCPAADHPADPGADLESGGDVLLLAESLSVPDFVEMMDDVRADRLSDEADFPEPPADGRVLVLLSYP
jgi:hypothetical protein